MLSARRVAPTPDGAGPVSVSQVCAEADLKRQAERARA
jgi:hypothetical protein